MVRFSPKGQRILTASADRTAKIWALNGTLLADMLGHAADIEDNCMGEFEQTLNDENEIIDGGGRKLCALSLEDRRAHLDRHRPLVVR